MEPCIICGSAAVRGGNVELQTFDCDRCGPFKITGSAVAVLPGKLARPNGEPDQVLIAKASHYVRTHSTSSDWLLIGSPLINEMLAQKLPGPSQQLDLLMRWMADQVGEDHLRALEFWASDVCAIMGAASPEAAEELIEDAIKADLIRYVPEDCYQLTRHGWDKLIPTSVSSTPNHSDGDFVDNVRIAQLKAINGGQFDTSRLVRMCEEINSCWRSGNLIAVVMLSRAIIDHVPPIFAQQNFAQVASQMSRSIKPLCQNMENSLRHIADGALHTHIGRRETVPTRTQVDFRPNMDVLLAEVVRHLS